MRIVFYSASTSAHSNSSTKTTYQPFRADTWDEMDRLYPDCEFVVAGPLNGSYIFDVADAVSYTHLHLPDRGICNRSNWEYR